MKISHLPPVEFLEECFFLDRGAGTLTWKVRPRGHFKSNGAWNSCNSRHAGKPVGCLNADGYLRVKVDDKTYNIHRIIWKLATGFDPAEEIDHINGNRSDNRLCNLREATHGENRRNSRVRKDSLLQVKGIRRESSGKFLAEIWEAEKNNRIGRFPSLEEAQAAYEKKARELYGEFFRDPTRAL